MSAREMFGGWPMAVFEISVMLFVFAVGVGVLVIIAMYIYDATQSEHTIRRNYPVIGRFRYGFERLGEFFRQYFFSMDREEMPFNRSQRAWAYRSAKDIGTVIAFGSTRRLDRPGDVLFLNDLFPTQVEDAVPPRPITIGKGFAEKPFTAQSLFNISGMSYGALSRPAVRALSNGAKEAGIWMNTGEGGVSPYHLESGCDLVFQIGTAKYGVRDEKGALCEEKLKQVGSYEQVRMFEIKMSQGAKPGKGGILPAVKVTPAIAEIRGIPVGVDSRSPNGHREIRNVDDLLDMIVRVRRITGKPCGFKTAVGRQEWVDDLLLAVHRRGVADAPDFITVDGADGGSGAAPQGLMDFAGLPLSMSLPMVVDKLNEYGLRERIRVVASGKLINPSGIAWALCLGADFVVSARGFMFALGCVQALQCDKNVCPTGITTHNKHLQRGLNPVDKAQRVANFATNTVHEVEMIAHSCGVADPRDLNRSHAFVINGRGDPEPMEVCHPNVQTAAEYRGVANAS